MQKDRIKAKYIGLGLHHFTNPDPNAAIAYIAYCSIDSMYHVGLRYSPFENDNNLRTANHVLSSLSGFDETDIDLSHILYELRKDQPEPQLPDGFLKQNPDFLWGDPQNFEFNWYTGMDLQDLAVIVQKMKKIGLDVDWFDQQFQDLKKRAGLNQTDLPYFDRHWNRNCLTHGRGLREIIHEHYHHALFSVRGGTISFKEIPDRTLNAVARAMVSAGAIVEEPIDTDYSTDMRFFWVDQPIGQNPTIDDYTFMENKKWVTRQRLVAAISTVPNVLNLQGETPKNLSWALE